MKPGFRPIDWGSFPAGELVKALTWKNFSVLLAVLVGGLLLYYGHFRAKTNADAGLVYGLAAFLFYATGRKYLNHPVFETSSGMALAVALLFIYIGLADNHNGSLALGILVAFAGFLAYGWSSRRKNFASEHAAWVSRV